MDIPIRVADLPPGRDARLAEILRATRAFSEDEVGVAVAMYAEDAERVTRGAGTAAAPAAVAAASAGATGTAGAAAPVQRVGVASDVAEPDYVFLGAFTPEDELLGYACYGPTPGTDRTYDLYWIAVDPAVKGAGVGTILLSEVERRLEGRQARMLVVETSSRSDYARARGFYERRGYAERARVRDFYAPGDDRIILTKRIRDTRPMGGERSRHE